jgi:hypothetical protein
LAHVSLQSIHPVSVHVFLTFSFIMSFSRFLFYCFLFLHSMFLRFAVQNVVVLKVHVMPLQLRFSNFKVQTQQKKKFENYFWHDSIFYTPNNWNKWYFYYFGYLNYLKELKW